MAMTYRELLPDWFRFGRDTYGEDSSHMAYLPKVAGEVAAGTEEGADADLHFILNLLAFAHLGYPCCFDTREVLDLGVDLSVHWIRGKWVEAHPRYAATIDKRPDNPEFRWSDAYRLGLLVMLLSDRDVELREFADWPEAWMETQPAIWHMHPLDAKLTLLIANEFRTTPFPQIEELRNLFLKARKKEHKVLYGTWEAVLARDQGAFERGIVASVREWERAYDGECAHPRNCIADDASTILAAGRRLGLELPEFEPKVAARLLTRESIRLGTCHEVDPHFAGPVDKPKDALGKALRDFGIGRRDD